MDSAQNGNSSPERTELISEADRICLAGQLSPHVMDELLGLLAVLPPDSRERLVNEVRAEAESRGDRAVFLALARVAYDNDPERPDLKGGGS